MLVNPDWIVTAEAQAGGESLIRLVDGEAITVRGSLEDIARLLESGAVVGDEETPSAAPSRKKSSTNKPTE